MFEDNLPKPKPNAVSFPTRLDDYSVDDLHAYKLALEAELVRVMAETKKKQDYHQSANALFGNPNKHDRDQTT